MNKEYNMEMGNRLRIARETAGFTQEYLAELVDVSVQYMSDLERGKVGASLSTFRKLCTTLLVSSDYLLLGSEEKNDLSDVIERLRYLNPRQLEIVENMINIVLDAFNN